MRKPVDHCDECDAAKGISNGWHVALGTPEAPHFYSHAAADEVDEEVGEMTEDRKTMRKEFCSQSCVLSAFSRWLDSGSIEKPENQSSTSMPFVTDDADDIPS